MRKIFAGLMAAMVLAGCGAVKHSTPAAIHADSRLKGHLKAFVFNSLGVPVAMTDLGDGTVTNVGVMAMSNDSAWPAPSGAAINTLATEKYCQTGTSTTSAAATDITLGTADSAAVATGTITPTLTTANSQSEKVVCTTSYSGSEAVTEWGLFNNSSGSTPITSTTANCGTCSATVMTVAATLTASSTTAQGDTTYIMNDSTGSPQFYGLITSNTTSAVTVPAWFNVSNGATSSLTPVNADTARIRPVMLDHLVFSAINVVSGDSIQWTFTLSLPSGS